VFAVFACSNPNTQSGFNPETGKHLGNWVSASHKSLALTNLSACAECHGADFSGGISGVPCSKCHINTGTNFSCSACHGYPPVTNKHPQHTFLNVYCLDCHNNTIGTPLHNNGTADVSVSATFYSKSGAALYATGACSNISCHGGPRTQTSTQAGQNPPFSDKTQTPAWTTGSINVDTDCILCHVYGSAEYNNYYSGEHRRHVYSENIDCTSCHDTTKVAGGHFTSLHTSGMEGPASATLLNGLNYDGRSCDPSCHGREDW
jgi:predicted CxxxxCH...CXXCH cytochrome family protein